MQIKANAKINWALNVTGLRADGYHLLEMLTQRLELSDLLTLQKKSDHSGIDLIVKDDEHLPTYQDNLVYKAAMKLQQYTGIKVGADIVLEKRIPQQAGLGGGSADAAATLLALNRLWETNLTLSELERIACTLGADVPLCLHHDLCRVMGIGEIIEPLSAGPGFDLLLLKPEKGLSTRDVFTAYDKTPDPKYAQLDLLAAAIQRRNIHQLKQYAHNQLQTAALVLLPEIEKAIEALYRHGAALSMMTGAGSVVFGVFPDHKSASLAEAALSSYWPVCILTRTI